MPRFHLTFNYPGRNGETIVGSQTVTRGSLEDAAEYVATQRGLSFIHVRTCDGEAVERGFTFAPSETSEAV
jgi:hypothetical protein